MDDDAQFGGRLGVRHELSFGPPLGGVLHGVRRGHHLDAQAAYQLQCAGVHPGHAGEAALGRVLHCDATDASQQFPQARHHLAATDEDHGVNAHVREPAAVDVAQQQPGLALRRHPEPAGPGDVGDGPNRIPEDRVHAAVVVEQPAIDSLGGEMLASVRQHGVDCHI